MYSWEFVAYSTEIYKYQHGVTEKKTEKKTIQYIQLATSEYALSCLLFNS